MTGSDATEQLYRAVLAGDLDEVRGLLARGADPNAHNLDNGWTVLMLSASDGRDDIVAELLRQPSLDVEARDERGRTALHIAAERGDAGVVGALLAVSNPNLVDSRRETALHRAAGSGAREAVETLLADSRTNPGIKTYPDGWTAADIAGQRGHEQVARALDAVAGRGSDELSPGDPWTPAAAGRPGLITPFTPELPGLREG